jgi:hypothetical protein
LIDVCHFTPEGIERLADTLLPGVAELVEDTAAYRAWRRSARRPEPSRVRASARSDLP